MGSALENFGIDEWKIQKTYNNCMHITETAESVLFEAGVLSEELSDLHYFFDSEISKSFNKVQKETEPFNLEDIGENLKDIMLIKTAMVLNSQPVLEKIGLNKFGVEDMIINDSKDISDILKKSSFSNAYDIKLHTDTVDKEASKISKAEFKRIFCDACINTLAQYLAEPIFTDNAMLDMLTWDSKEDVLMFTRILEEKISNLSNSDLTIKDVCKAIFKDGDSLIKVVEEINDFMREVKEERIAREIDE